MPHYPSDSSAFLHLDPNKEALNHQKQTSTIGVNNQFVAGARTSRISRLDPTKLSITTCDITVPKKNNIFKKIISMVKNIQGVQLVRLSSTTYFCFKSYVHCQLD